MRIETEYSVSPMTPRPAPSAGFSAAIHGPTPPPAPRTRVGEVVGRHVQSLMDQEAEINTALEQTAAGDGLSQREMLELQATVYSYGQKVDVATRVVDRSAGALRQLLNTQL